MRKNQQTPFRRKSIQGRLLINFILVAVLPTIAISLGSLIFGYYNARQSAVKRLESLIALEEIKINTWLENGQNELLMTFNEPFLLERIQVSLQIQNKPTYYSYYHEGALFRVNRYLADMRLLKSISILDLDGNVILSSDAQQENQNYAGQSFFTAGSLSTISQISPIPGLVDGFGVITASPIEVQDGQVIGVLMGVIRPESLAELLMLPADGGDERVFLVNEQNILIGPPASSLLLPAVDRPPSQAVHTPGIDRALVNKASGFASYKNEYGDMVYGVYRWIPRLNLALLVEEKRSSILAEIFTNQIINLLMIAGGIGLAVFISLVTAQRIATPLESLVKASVEIASGNFIGTELIDQEDEIGVLAKAFNSMSSQLHSLVENLEGLVRGRTAELQESNLKLTKRARQLETTSKVSREITSILDIDQLLNRVVNLILESFGYYHVSIYLLDKSSNSLIWRAGSGDICPENRVLALSLNCLNSKAVKENQPLMLNDVRQDPVFLSDSYLPETQSELVIPLRIGGQAIGTMDIQHNTLNAFSMEDLHVLMGLGDQITIAIHNAELYTKTQSLAILEERNRMARELHDSISQILYTQVLFADAGSEYFQAGHHVQALEYINQLKVSAHQALKEMRLMIYELRPSILENQGLWGAIQNRLDTVERRSGVEVKLNGSPAIKIPRSLEKELYLIAQEALNNVLKHSHASLVEVSLYQNNGFFEFCIADDGVGFSPETVKSGLGLENIRQHSQRMGGEMTIHSQPGQGTRLTISIPEINHDK